ncbi:MAG TPA: LysR family transcriptional regulator [Alteromonas sp.]|jgi:LysR family nitrogen assimilation transcriptional regulator|nr:LysR family transcriptional regulator [Alteromonas sp.]HCA75892.1 LysR family transcriptional regulator [Alteromonas sp.]HCV17182.1 LysR family transcriptional regulator [Alteromonas sp.]|tara:strand:- start:8167 stop:9180 length:1014 start_codon:yes stop_codon:yes gene_type:complete
MNSKQLQYFLVTVQKGSIAAAARELDIAQPAISQQLANLEREMGSALFERSFKGVSLTAAGEVFEKHAKKLIEDINAAKMELHQLAANQHGVVRVGMLPSIGNVLSMSLIAMVNEFHPQLKLEISTGPSYAVKEWLKTNQVDIALTYEQEVESRFMSAYPLIEEFMYLVVGVNEASAYYQLLQNRDTICFWELSQFELLTPGPKDALGRLIEKYEHDTGVALKHDKAYSGQLMTGLRQVIQGEGLMILPSSAMYHLEESKVIKSLKITQPDMKRQVLAATNSNFAMTDAIVKMLSIIQEASSTEQACGHWRGNLLNKVPKSDARSMGFASSSTVSVL